MLDKRQDWFVTPGVALLAAGFKTYYDLSYQHTGRLASLRTKPFVLLPNHQSNQDILLEGILLRDILGRNADYLMKASLPASFEYLGGIRIMRSGDISETSKRLAAEHKQRIYDLTIPLKLFNQGIVVVHPEGTRKSSSEETIRRNLKNLLRSQQVLATQIPFVPLHISYGRPYVPRSKVTMSVGEPITVHADERGLEKLTQHWLKETTS